MGLVYTHRHVINKDAVLKASYNQGLDLQGKADSKDSNAVFKHTKGPRSKAKVHIPAIKSVFIYSMLIFA